MSARHPGLGAKVLSSYVALAAQILYVLGVTAFIVHQAGKEVFGGFAIVLAVMSVVRLLDLGVGPTTARFVAASREPGELNRVVATSLAFLLGVAAVGAMVTLPVALLGNRIFDAPEDLRWPLLVGCVGSCALLPLGVFTNVLYGLDRIVARNMVLIVRPVAAFIGVVVVVEAGGGLLAIVCAAVGAELSVVAAQVAYTLVTVPGLRPRRRDVRRDVMRRIAPFSAAMLALSVAAQITYYSGNIVVGAALGAGAAAVFGVASRLVEGITQLINQFGDIFLPSFARLSAHGRDDDARAILVGGTTATLVVGYPAIAVLAGLGAPLIQLWVGDGFEDAWLPLVLLCGGVAFTAPIRFGVLHAIGAARHGAIARVAMVEAVANLALGILLVNLVGLWGVALAVVTSLAVSNGIVIPHIVYPQVGLSTWHDYHRRVLLALAPMLALVALLHVVIGPGVEGSLLLLVLAAAVAYPVGVLVVAALLGELGRVRGLVQRLTGAGRTAAAQP